MFGSVSIFDYRLLQLPVELLPGRKPEKQLIEKMKGQLREQIRLLAAMSEMWLVPLPLRRR